MLHTVLKFYNTQFYHAIVLYNLRLNVDLSTSFYAARILEFFNTGYWLVSIKSHFTISAEMSSIFNDWICTIATHL